MLDLCEEIFARNGIRSLRYDGQMNREAREFTLGQFRQAGGPKVILVRYVTLPRSARGALSHIPAVVLSVVVSD